MRRAHGPKLQVATFILVLLISPVLVACGGTTSATPAIPTPNSQRTEFHNPQFAYKFIYPTQWPLQSLDNQSLVRVLPNTTSFVPDALAFDVRCAGNPKQLDAEKWWQQDIGANTAETAVGPVKLSSGLVAYAAAGHGQTSFKVYVVTSKSAACVLTAYDVSTAVNPFIASVVNSFAWS
jgi:hypothetical protein